MAFARSRTSERCGPVSLSTVLLILLSTGGVSNTAFAVVADWGWLNPLPQGNDFYGVWGTGANDVYVVGGDEILYDNGTTWSAMTPQSTKSLNGVWGSGPGDVFAVGVGGAIQHFPRWRVDLTVPRADLGAGSAAYSAGNQATLTAAANANATFTRREGDVPGATSTTNPLALTMTADRSVTLVFTDTAPPQPSCCAVQGGLTLPFLTAVAAMFGLSRRRGRRRR